MIIIGTARDLEIIRGTCDGRCADGQGCVFQDIASNCPVDNSNDCIEVRKNRLGMLEVVDEL